MSASSIKHGAIATQRCGRWCCVAQGRVAVPAVRACSACLQCVLPAALPRAAPRAAPRCATIDRRPKCNTHAKNDMSGSVCRGDGASSGLVGRLSFRCLSLSFRCLSLAFRCLPTGRFRNGRTYLRMMFNGAGRTRVVIEKPFGHDLARWVLTGLRVVAAGAGGVGCCCGAVPRSCLVSPPCI